MGHFVVHTCEHGRHGEPSPGKEIRKSLRAKEKKVKDAPKKVADKQEDKAAWVAEAFKEQI
jgi:hypothetical protein